MIASVLETEDEPWLKAIAEMGRGAMTRSILEGTLTSADHRELRLQALCALHKQNLWSETRQQLVIETSSTGFLVALQELSAPLGALTAELFGALRQLTLTLDFKLVLRAKAIKALYINSHFTPAQRAANVTKILDTRETSFLEAIAEFGSSRRLAMHNQALFDELFAHPRHAVHLMNALYTLLWRPALASQRPLLLNDTIPEDALRAVARLNYFKKISMTPTRFETLLKHPTPFRLVEIFTRFDHFSLLTEATMTRLETHRQLTTIDYFLVRLSHDQHTHDILDGLLTHAAHLEGGTIRTHFERIPEHLRTADFYTRLFAACAAQQDRPEARARAAIVNFLQAQLPREEGRPDEPALAAGRAAYADAQSTHRDTVHESASSSARDAEARYGGQITHPDRLWTALRQAYPAGSVERRALDWLANPINGSHLDRASGVTLERLLLLTWCAAQDTSSGMASVSDAMDALGRGLTDIVRAYNVGVTGVDNGGADRHTCLPGAFNKLIECMVGIRPYAKLVFVTSETISLQYQGLVREQVRSTLRTDFASLDNAGASAVLDELNEGMTDALWLRIRPTLPEVFWRQCTTDVSEAALAVFTRPYPGGMRSPAYHEYIDQGKYIDLTPVIATLRHELTTRTVVFRPTASGGGFFSPPRSPLIPDQMLLTKIQGVRDQLQKEIDAWWPYPNKDRKRIKWQALDDLMKAITRGDNLMTTIAAIEIRPGVRDGHISTRTADLLDGLKRDYAPGSGLRA